MKKLFLFISMMATTLSMVSAEYHWYQDVTKSLTMMIGTSDTINPYVDAGFGTSLPIDAYESMDYAMYYDDRIDNSAFTITPTQYNTTDGKYYKTYQLDALRRGTYKMIVTIKYGYYAPAMGYFKGNSLKVTYNINVVDVTRINMPTSLNLKPGDVYTLEPQILETGATSKLTWTSSNTGVAIVNDGTIRVLRVGETDIICTAYNGVSATCRLVVVPIIAEDFKLEETACELEPNETFQLTPQFTPFNTTDQSVTYKSSNTKVATVDANGIITGVNMGSCTITASTNDGSFLSATCSVTVKPTVTEVRLNGAAEIAVGESTTLQATILQEGVETTLTWSSSNTAIATVDNNGTVNALKPGNVTIICTAANGVSGSFNMTVTPLKELLLSAKRSYSYPNSLRDRSRDSFFFVTSPPYSFSLSSGGDSAACSSI
ncbi:MAG: Ig domain-containing protein, partial [Bacteroidaceae bacterium]|nr:Ig domain-containing protein [Bacteroidaceae bacterium]